MRTALTDLSARTASRAAPPVARPMAWSKKPRNTCSGGVTLETGARTVLVLPGSPTSTSGRWPRRCSGAGGYGSHALVPGGRQVPRRTGDHDGGDGDGHGGCRPVAPTTLSSSLSFSSSSTARKGSTEGGGW